MIMTNKGETAFVYEKSYALLLGNSDYSDGWDDLSGVTQDIASIEALLKAQGFTVIVKTNLTGDGIRAALSDFQAEYGQSESRLLIWFAGHGASLRLDYGDDSFIGYIVGIDAPNPKTDERNFRRRSVSMQSIDAFMRETDKPRHILFVFDACFSGAYFNMRGLENESPFINDMTSKPARQIIASGSKGQKVPDHSIFRRYFVNAIQQQKADFNGDGYVTGTELGMYLKTNVTNESGRMQTPQYGTVQDVDLSQGDFVFRVKDLDKIKPYLITMSVPESVFAGGQDTFSANAGGNAVTYTWDMGNGKVMRGAEVKHRYKKAGRYTITLTMENRYGKTVDRRTIRVLSPQTEPLALQSFTMPGVVYAGEEEVYGAMAKGERVMYTWDMGEGEKISGETIKYVYKNPGMYKIRLTLSNTSGQLMEEKSVTVQKARFQSPNLAWRIPADIREGEQLLYEIEGQGDGITCIWDMGDGVRKIGRQVTHVYQKSGHYTIKVVLDNGTTRVWHEREVAVASGLKYPEIANLTMPSTVKVGENVAYIADARGEKVGVNWDFGDGTTGEGSKMPHTYLDEGVYTVVVTLWNAHGSVKVSRSIKVEPAKVLTTQILSSIVGLGLVAVGVMGVLSLFF